MKKIIGSFIGVIVIVLLVIIVILLEKNNNNIANSSNEYSNINNKIVMENVSEIVCKNIYKKDTRQDEKIYNIINEEKINQIKELVKSQDLIETDNEPDNENYIEITMYSDEEKEQLIVDDNNNIKQNEQVYQVDTQLYQELINILNPTYSLHNSDLELPSQEKCITMQEKALNNMSDNEINEISTRLREAHTTIENLLINGVKNLKQSNSIYWNLYNEAETIIEESGDGLEFSKDYCFRAVANDIIDITDIIKDEDVKQNFDSIYEKLNKAMEFKDIAEIFAVHEMIHDYDYWVINYPAYYDTAPAPDWKGIETYFGTTI